MSVSMDIDEISSAAATEAPGDYTDTPTSSAGGRLADSEEHLNIPTDKRRNLLTELSDALGNKPVPAAFWAFVQVCDIGQLQELSRKARIDPAGIDLIMDSCKKVIDGWIQWRSSGSSPARSERSANSRSKDPTKLAYLRDDNRCVFTRSIYKNAAHIYSHCLINPQSLGTAPAGATLCFWKLLEHFWPRKQLERWQREIFPDPQDPSKTEDGCFNRICIGLSIHRAWQRGHFALRPLKYNADRSELEVEWYWQPQQTHGKDDLVELGKIPPSSRDLDGYDGSYVYSNRTRIRSGQIFILTTRDPDNLPLPSKRLLDLQWHLNRVASMSAAGEGLEEDDYDDDYGDGDSGTFLRDDHRDDVEHWISQSASLPFSPSPQLPFSETGSHDESDIADRSKAW